MKFFVLKTQKSVFGPIRLSFGIIFEEDLVVFRWCVFLADVLQLLLRMQKKPNEIPLSSSDEIFSTRARLVLLYSTFCKTHNGLL